MEWKFFLWLSNVSGPLKYLWHTSHIKRFLSWLFKCLFNRSFLANVFSQKVHENLSGFTWNALCLDKLSILVYFLVQMSQVNMVLSEWHLWWYLRYRFWANVFLHAQHITWFDSSFFTSMWSASSSLLPNVCLQNSHMYRFVCLFFCILSRNVGSVMIL